MLHKRCEWEDIEFVNPIDGDVLNEYDGEIKEMEGHKSLAIRVKVAGPAGSRIKVNGVYCTTAGKMSNEDCCSSYSHGSRYTQVSNKELYEATIMLDGYRNTIEAKNEDSGNTCQIVVYWIKNATKKYRISTDDNIWFLRDITQNRDVYESIFDNPYLKVFKKVHDMYGSKTHFNLFYQTEDFNLSQMTDKFKGEWQANADWIKLSFHSLQEFPDKPYDAAAYEDMKRDYLLVTNEIARFAGEELLSTVTTTHWGTATVPAARALRSLGIRGLVGYFKHDAAGKPLVSYYIDSDLVKQINKRDCWKDNCEDIMFVKHDIVLDSVKIENIVPYLDDIKKDPHQGGLIEILIHEQYFYDYYIGYQPEYEEKVMTAAEWAAENGYEPAFWSEVVLEK